MDEFKGFIMVPTMGRKTSHCFYPLRLDTYGKGCTHGCVYCYASNLLRKYGSWKTEPCGADPAKVKKLFDDALGGKSANMWTLALRNKVPVRMGGMTDCFGTYEKKHGVSLKVLKMLHEHDYPYIIMTKGTVLGETKYIDALDEDNAVVQVTITTNDKLAAKIEPGAPSTSKRLALIKRLDEAGIHTACRIAPLIPGEFDFELVEKACAAGAKTIVTEFLRVPMNREKKFAEHFPLDGFEMRDNQQWQQPIDIKRMYLECIKEICSSYGVESTVCDDSDYEELRDFRANQADCCNALNKVRGFRTNFESVRPTYLKVAAKLADKV